MKALFPLLLLTLTALFLSMISSNFFVLPWISFPLISILLAVLLFSRKTLYTWMFIVGFFGESISPFPPFVYLAAILVTVWGADVFVRYFVSKRTFLGAGLTGVVGTLLFEISIYIFAKLGSGAGIGWIPVLDYSYFISIGGRMIATVTLLGVLFFILQRFSPSVRGTILTYR